MVITKVTAFARSVGLRVTMGGHSGATLKSVNISGYRQRQFRKGVEHKLMPHLGALQDATRIAAMLPFRHRPLRATLPLPL